ncbi:MAG TPA: hypothetical protein VJQ56_12150 [Blastocatellia bacterium]|nr:hypothetical protein [Blastocatellia bacterium]
MLVEFFLERSVIEISNDGLSCKGSVPELPELLVEAANPQECRNRLAEAIADLLLAEVKRSESISRRFDR